MPINKTCPICNAAFQCYSYRPRNTCGETCRAVLAAQTEAARQKTIVAKAAASPLRTSMLVRNRSVPDVPRRKCPVCERRVRLASPIPGLLWLRSHYDQTGKECAGSRDIVCYPREKELATDD